MLLLSKQGITTQTIDPPTVVTERKITQLGNAIPAVAYDDETHIVIHSHKIIIQRQTGIYKTFAVLEGVFLITSSLFMISLSGLSIVFALAVLK